GATRPGHYPRLAELIRVYAAGEGIADLREAARRWYERVYRPMAAQLRRAQLTRLFPGERTAELVVHLADLRAADEQRRGRRGRVMTPASMADSAPQWGETVPALMPSAHQPVLAS